MQEFNLCRCDCALVSFAWWFAGTADKTGRIFGKPSKTLIDVKAGSMAPHYHLQTAGYEIAYNEMNPKSPIRARYVLVLMPDDYRLIPCESKTDHRYFKAATTVAEWRRNNGRIKK